MKILFLTQYFPPETGAPQNRLYDLAVRLQRKGVKVTVLTAMPNYPQMEVYKGYKGKVYHYENKDGIEIHRSYIYASRRKSILLRLANYFSFTFSSFFTGVFRLGRFDYIFCESPPLFLGISAFLLTKIKGGKLLFNVSDLWPESAERLGIIKNKFLISLATGLEEFLYKKAVMVSGQTKGIIKNISSRFPEKKVYWLPNGADINFYNPEMPDISWRKEQLFSSSDFLLLYGGIVGHAQGLEVILKAAEKLKGNVRIRFIILGEGPEKEKLISMKNDMQLANVFFLNSVPKEKMPSVLSSVDAAIVPLKKLNLFLGAIPSKIFETLAMEKPILLGVEGEAKELFIDQAGAGISFIPEDDKDLAEKIKYLSDHPEKQKEMGKKGRVYVKNNFERDLIAENFLEVLGAHLKNGD